MYEYLRQRALRGSREKYEAALHEVPDIVPEEHDALKEAVAGLDPGEERALAEEGLAADFEAWPDYSDPIREVRGGQLGERESEVTGRLDEIYGRHDSSLDAALRRAQRRSIDRDS